MKVQNKYEKVERIGQGAFSKVFKVRNRKTKQFLSMKEIDLSLMTPKMRKGTEREIRILRLMDHENIISLVESFRIDGKINIVTEFCSRGDLGKYIRTKIKLLSEEIIMKIFVQVCLGMEYMHRQGVVHRDINVTNIFLKNNFEVRIGDFGESRLLFDIADKKPDVIPEDRFYVDMVSLGSFLYELCMQNQSFKTSKIATPRKGIKKGSLKEIPDKYSPKLKTLLNQILYCDADEQLSMARILSNEYVRENIRKLETELSKKQNINRKIHDINAKVRKPRGRRGLNDFQYEKNAPEVQKAMLKRNPGRIITDTTKELLHMRNRKEQREHHVQMQVDEEVKPVKEEQAGEEEQPEEKGKEPEQEPVKPQPEKKKKIPPIHAKHNVKSSRLLEIYEKNRRRRKKKSRKKPKKLTSELPLKFIKGKKHNKGKNYVGQRKKKPKKTADKSKTGNSSNWLSHSDMLMRSMIYQRMRHEKQSRVIRSELPNQETSAVPLQNHLKNQGALPRKCTVVMKEFGQWFTEDYFENCLILDGEFGLNYLSEFKIQASPQDEQTKQSKQSKSPSGPSFLKKKTIEKVDDASSHLASNERQPLTRSNEYTVSNNRNQIGREMKQIIEEKSRQLLRKGSRERDLRSRSGLNLDKHFDSIQFSVFLNKMRIVLRFMKQQQTAKMATRSKNKSVELSSKGRRRGGPRRLRRVQSCKKTEVYDQWLKMSVVDSVEWGKDDQRIDLEVYLRYHNKFLGTMEGFLRQKWSEELLESSQLIELGSEKTARDFKKKPEIVTNSSMKKSVKNSQFKKKQLGMGKKEGPKSEFLLKFDSTPKSKQKLVNSQIIGNSKQIKQKFDRKKEIEKSKGKKKTKNEKIIQTSSKIKNPIKPNKKPKNTKNTNKKNPRLKSKNNKADKKGDETKNKIKKEKIKKEKLSEKVDPDSLKSEILKSNLLKSEIQAELQKSTVKDDNQDTGSATNSDKISNQAVYDLRKSKFPSRAQSTKNESKTDQEVKSDSNKSGESPKDPPKQEAIDKPIADAKAPENDESNTFKVTKLDENISFQDLNKSLEQLKDEYDLKIQNVVLSQEVASQLGNEVMEMSINALRNVGKELLGGLLQIDSKFAKRANPPNKMNLQEIRELHYLQQQMIAENSHRVGVKSRTSSPSQVKRKGNFKKIQSKNFEIKINKIKKDLSIGKRPTKKRLAQSMSFQPSELLHSMMPPRKKNNPVKKRRKRRSKVNKSAHFLNLRHLNQELSNERTTQRSQQKAVKFSVNRQAKPTQWRQERNKRKKQRVGSQQKFFKQMRKSLHRLSARMGVEEQHRSMQNNFIRDLSDERKSTSIRACSEDKPVAAFVRTMPDIDTIPEKYTSSRFVSESRTSEFERTHHNILNYSFGQKDPNARTFPVQTRILEPRSKKKRHLQKKPLSKRFAQNDILLDSMEELRRKINEPLTRLNKKNRLSKKAQRKRTPSQRQKKKKKKKMIEWNRTSSSSERQVQEIAPGDDASSEQDISLQSGIPLNVSQSNSEPRPSMTEKKRRLIDFEEINDFQIRNLNKNFNSFASWFFVNKCQPKPATKGKANLGSQGNAGQAKSLRPSNISSLKEKKREVMKTICGKIEKKEVKEFMLKVFDKFSRKKFFGDKEIERLAEKHFGESANIRNKIVPQLYQLIDIEISIQSKHLNRMI